MGDYAGHDLRPGNFWTSFDSWPAPTVHSLYMQPGKILSIAPAAIETSATYTYDPFDPTPMLGGNNLPFGHYKQKVIDCGSADQIERENRADVVVFDSGALDEDLPVVGRIQAKLFVSSSANDTDFVVTISDLSEQK